MSKQPLVVMKLRECIDLSEPENAALQPCPLNHEYREGFAVGMEQTEPQRQGIT